MAQEAEARIDVARDPNVGRVIAGRYRITARLGGGGMGVVYSAEHAAIGKRVALKMLHAQFAADQAVVGRFLNEARAAALVEHRNIVDALDFGQTDDGAPYLVLEYLEGHDLAKELGHGPLPVERAATIASQVASALQAAHEKGIVHRDLKPENVYLVDNEPEAQAVRVLDFGISKVSGGIGMTATGISMGTPQYMAPEQFLDAARADARSDIYSLGAMLYEMLAGELPIAEPSFGAMAIAVMNRRPQPLRERQPATPEALANLVDSMITREADSRPASMRDVVNALAPFAHGLPEPRPSIHRASLDAAVAPTVAPNTHIAVKSVRGLEKPSMPVLPMVLGALGLTVLGGLAWSFLGSTPTAAPPTSTAPTPAVSPAETTGPGAEVVPATSPVPEIPNAMDPPADMVEPEVVSRIRQARARGDVGDALTALGTSQRSRDQLSVTDIELIAGLCEDTLRLSEARLGADDPSEAIRLSRMVRQLSLASDEHRRRAEQLNTRAEAAIAARGRAAAEAERAREEAAAAEAERVREEAARAEAARRVEAAPQNPPTTGRRLRQLESENPYESR